MKKLAIAVPDVAPALRASEATIDPQYARPASTVTTAATRNHQRARDMRTGNTLPLVGGSSSFIKGTFTRLKKYNNPIQVTPAMKCTQRNSISRLVLKSEGRLILCTGGSSPELTIVDSGSANANRRRLGWPSWLTECG